MKNKINSHFRMVVIICTCCITLAFLKFAFAKSVTKMHFESQEKILSQEVENFEKMEQNFKAEIAEKERLIKLNQDKLNKLKKDIFETVQEIHIIKQNVRELFKSKKNTYEGLTTLSAISSNIIPENIIYPKNYKAEDILSDSETSSKRSLVKPWGRVAINRFGGLVTVDSVGEKFKHKYFRITYSGLPSHICEALILSRWEDSYIGSTWIGVNGFYFSWEKEFEENSLPIDTKTAKQICKKGGYFQIGFE